MSTQELRQEQVVGAERGQQPMSAAVAERRAQAAAIRRQGDQALHDGNWQRAQQLYQESDAVFSGKPFVSPAVAERRAAPADSGRRAQHETGGRNGSHPRVPNGS
jgi:hypothetical protein